jgi:hypothetical protein
MRYIIALVVVVGGAVIITTADKIMRVEVKSPSTAREIAHRVLLMVQGGLVLLLLPHW